MNRLFVRAFISFVCAISPAAAQTTFATITGRVTDASGAAVAGAAVAVTHLASNYQYKTVSNSTGAYTIGELREGNYTLKITAAGFKKSWCRTLPCNRSISDVLMRLSKWGPWKHGWRSPQAPP